MGELEKIIEQTNDTRGKFDAEKAKLLRKETVQMYDKTLTKCKWLTWICLLVFAIVTVGAIQVLVSASNTKTLVISAVVILGVGQLEVLMKLWYWIMNNKLKVLKEVKQIELQIAQLNAEEDPDGN
jgi:hypothetical protein